MSARIRKTGGLRSPSLRANGLLLLAFSAFAISFGVTTPIRAQGPTPSNSTPLNDWIQDVRNDATERATEFFFDHLTLEPSFIEWGKTLSTSNLQIATRNRDYSASWAWFYADQLSDIRATIESARATAIDLQSQLNQARNTLGTQQSGSTRISAIEANLRTVNSTLKQATAYQGYLESRLASAESDLRQAQIDISNAQRGVFYSNEVAPRVNIGVNFAAEHLPLFFIGRDAFDLATNPMYRVQTADAASSRNDLLLNVASYLLRNTFSGDYLLPGVVSFDQTVNRIKTTYNAFEHQNESINLAFSGTLSYRI